MSEIYNPDPSAEVLRIHDQELAYMSALLTQAAMRDDLSHV